MRPKKDECYTPEYLVRAARRTMGSIALDPASSEEANQIVKATRFFTKEDNGLRQSWAEFPTVWINPPFSAPTNWVRKLQKATDVAPLRFQACMLTSNDTSTRWAQQLLGMANCACFLRGRTQFYGPDVQGTSNRSGHIVWFVGFGERQSLFCDNFSDLGKVVYL